jgi:hypothetical protein
MPLMGFYPTMQLGFLQKFSGECREKRLERVMHFAHDPAILAGWQGSLIPVT